MLLKIKQILHTYWTTIAVIIAILVTTVLSFMDFIPTEDISSYLLCTVGGLAITMFFETLKNDQNASDIIEQIKKNKCASKKVTRKEHYQLLNAAVVKANSQIWIMTIDSALSRRVVNTIPERKIYYNTIELIAKSKPNISVRRIYGLPVDEDARRDKIEWICSDLERFKDCPNYHVRVFDWKKFEHIPTPLSLQIVDDTFVGLVNLQQSSMGVEGGGEDLCVEDPNVVQHLKIYYETVWEKCDKLKTGNEIMLASLSIDKN